MANSQAEQINEVNHVPRGACLAVGTPVTDREPYLKPPPPEDPNGHIVLAQLTSLRVSSSSGSRVRRLAASWSPPLRARVLRLRNARGKSC